MISKLDSRIKSEQLLTILNDNEDILEACYGKAKDVNTDYLWFALKSGNVDLANRMYNLIKKNKYKLETTTELIEQVCEWFAVDYDYLKDPKDYDPEPTDEELKKANDAASVLKNWVKNIRDNEAKARIRVSLINYL